ncbi:MAG TPA: 5-carboxymethyl-2-hydroxymuconate isomerase, partial [Rhodospirillaceae bacterium]|nr:5-carboxymethyl-2-hydroxymuconate isomerase [Rhodospirillaceae bacterium]
MKLLTFGANDSTSFGMIDGDKVFDLASRMPDVSGLTNLLDPGAQKKALQAVAGADADYSLD